jgi:lysophospholipase L1-like esterase
MLSRRYIVTCLLALAPLGCTKEDPPSEAVTDSASADGASGVDAPISDAGASGAEEDIGAIDSASGPDAVAAPDTLDADAPGDASAPEDAADTAGPSPDTAAPGDVSPSDASAGLDVPTDGGAAPADVADAADTDPQTIAEKCFPGVSAGQFAPAYDQYAPVMGSHCFGTNHQTITGVQQVVFLGDSVTVGTPNDEHLIPTENDHYYRNQLAEWLTAKFNLNKGNLLDWGSWKSWDYIGFSGKGLKLVSGDFSNCSKFGARTDDLMTQIGECFPTGGSEKKTLVVFTMGGNDVAAITKSGGDATPEEVAAGYPDAWKLTQRTVEYLDEAMTWLTDPAHFPNGVYVVFANPFEFTDGTGVTSACKPAQIQIPFVGAFDLSQIDVNMAEVSGFKEWANKAVQKEMVVWLLDEYMRVATQYQVDLMLMLESFCGHGFVAAGANADAANACYKGAGAALWFDITCFHPSAAGHAAIATMFEAIIDE